MAKKDIETLRQETWELRYRLHVAVEINLTPLQEALKELLPDSKTRKRTFETWKAKGLWPCSPEEVTEMSERFATQWTEEPAEVHQPEPPVVELEKVSQESYVPAPDPNIPAAPPDTTQLAPVVTQAETSVIKEVSDECVQSPQEHTTEVERVSEKVTHAAPIDTQPIERHLEDVTHEVSDSTQATEQAPDISVTLGFTAFGRKEVEEMIQDMVQKEVEKAIASIAPGLQGEEASIEVRPLFKRDETVTRSIRISKAMAEMAEAKAKQERVTTGGNLNALIEVLLWDYLNRPTDLIEDES